MELLAAGVVTHLQSILSQYSVNTQSILSQYTVNIQSIHSQYTVNTQSIYSQYTVNTQSIHSQYTVNTQSIHSQYTVSIQSIHSPYTVNTQSTHSQYTVNIQSIYSQYTVSCDPPPLRICIVLVVRIKGWEVHSNRSHTLVRLQQPLALDGLIPSLRGTTVSSSQTEQGSEQQPERHHCESEVSCYGAAQ